MASFKRNRVVNTSLVLREIWSHREISRVQIAKNLDLDKSTVTAIINELLAEQIVLETAVGSAGPLGGRKPVLLRLNGAKGSLLGIELKPDGYTAMSVDLAGRPVRSWRGALRVDESNLAATFLELVERLSAQLDATAPLQGVGLGISGVIDSDHNIVSYSIPLGITRPWSAQREIVDRCSLPVYIENDANACAWAELAFHRTKRLRNFVFVLLEFRDPLRLQGLHERTALGLGIVIEGRVYRGRTFGAGEFRSVLRRPENRGQFSLSDEESARVTEDPELLRRVIEELAKNVALLTTTLNLDEVYLGGDIEAYGPLIVPIFEREMQDAWPYPDRIHCRIHFSSLGREAVAYGAAGLVLHRLFAELGSVGRLSRSRLAFPVGVAERYQNTTITAENTK